MAQFPFKYNVFGHLQFETASDAINYLQDFEKIFSLHCCVSSIWLWATALL